MGSPDGAGSYNGVAPPRLFPWEGAPSPDLLIAAMPHQGAQQIDLFRFFDSHGLTESLLSPW
jgi:hypothetical protein